MSTEQADVASRNFNAYAREIEERIRTGWMTGVQLTWSRDKGFTWSLHGDLDSVEEARRK